MCQHSPGVILLFILHKPFECILKNKHTGFMGLRSCLHCYLQLSNAPNHLKTVFFSASTKEHMHMEWQGKCPWEYRSGQLKVTSHHDRRWCMETEVCVCVPDSGQSNLDSLLSCRSSLHPSWQGPGYFICVGPTPSSE